MTYYTYPLLEKKSLKELLWICGMLEIATLDYPVYLELLDSEDALKKKEAHFDLTFEILTHQPAYSAAQ